MDRPVGIDMDERAGLVEMDQREGNAEFDRRQRKAALDIAAAGVEGRDLPPPRPVIGGKFELLDHRRQRRGILDQLAERRPVGAGAVEIGLSHIERVEPALMGDRIHHALDRQHALRAAKTAKGGVGDGVGLEAL